MSGHEWIEDFPVSATVCDAEGLIVEMNRKSREVFAADGGAALLGKNVLDCHPEPSRTTLAGLMDERRTNVYTIKKNGRKKLIYQSPWFEQGRYAGIVELSLELPADVPHFVREG